jgi:diguanylate cyclase (GGDEF)-like protein
MQLDYNSLLLALGFSGLCLVMTTVCFWLSARVERFMVIWAVGILILVGNIFAYDYYVRSPNILLGMVVLPSLVFGFAAIHAAALEYCSHPRTFLLPLSVAAIFSGLAVLSLGFGYDGAAFLAQNLGCAIPLLLTGIAYWRRRAEMPAYLMILSALYAACSLSFILCAAVLAANGHMALGHAPSNWAENLNIIVSIIGMTGIGAITLSLTQMRMAQRHRRDAETDPLTGLMNRRALFERYDGRRLGAFVAVLAFDLDNFKHINDAYGHAVGDDVLRLFAAIMRRNSRPSDQVVRLGGEEFALVMPRILPEKAGQVAEKIRAELAAEFLQTDMGALRCTVSAGIAFGSRQGAGFEDVLRRADQALYEAKRDGRNRVAAGGGWRSAG